MENDIALNNPFNLKLTNIQWLGLVPENPASSVFCQFITSGWGLRAGYINIKTQIKEGFNTIEKLITKYAPASDNNDTEAYIKAVCSDVGLSRSMNIVPENVLKLGRAIITHEQGRCIYTDTDLKNAVVNAGVKLDESTVPIRKSNAFVSWLCRVLHI